MSKSPLAQPSYIDETYDGSEFKCCLCGGTKPKPDTKSSKKYTETLNAFIQAHDKCQNIDLEAKFKKGTKVRVTPKTIFPDMIGKIGTTTDIHEDINGEPIIGVDFINPPPEPLESVDMLPSCLEPIEETAQPNQATER
jgi:hypothetical protein